MGMASYRAVLLYSNSLRSTSYALNMIGARGELFIAPGDEVYAGLVIGENSRSGDLEVNPIRSKGLTNVRTVLKEEKAAFAAVKRLSVEDLISYMNDDEVIEVTPKSVRLRKKVLDAGERAQAQKVKKQQRDAKKK